MDILMKILRLEIWGNIYNNERYDNNSNNNNLYL